MTYMHLGQQHARPVQVLTGNGTWVDGWLEAYRKVEGVWSGFVRHGTAPSETYLGWFEEGRIGAPTWAERPTVTS